MNRITRSLATLTLLALAVSGRSAHAQNSPVLSPAPPLPATAPGDSPPATPLPGRPADPGNAAAGSLPSAAAAVGEGYVLRPGDIIAINMVTMSGEAPISTPEGGLVIPLDGRISFHTVRGLQAAGLTRTQLENALINGVKRYIKNPNITVNLLATPYNYISISGSVEKPGDQLYRPGISFFEILTLAGGTRPTANKSALIYRKGPDGKSEFLTVDLMKLYNGDITQDLPMYPGDKVIINEAMIYVNGTVKSPGMLSLRTADTVGKAVAAAGGTAGGADLQNAFIRRGDQSIPVDLRQAVEGNGNGPELTVPLMAGDILYVPSLTGKVIVIGDTANTGQVLLTPRVNDKALDVLAQAGVSPRTSDLKRVLLIRNINGTNPVSTELNLGPQGSPSDNVILQNGDVIYVNAKKERDRNQTLLNATIMAQLFGALRTF